MNLKFAVSFLFLSVFCLGAADEALVSRGYQRANGERWPNLWIKNGNVFYLDTKNNPQPILQGTDHFLFGNPGVYYLHVEKQVLEFYRSLSPELQAHRRSWATAFPTLGICSRDVASDALLVLFTGAHSTGRLVKVR